MLITLPLIFSSTILWMTVFDEAIVVIMPNPPVTSRIKESSTLLDIEKPIIPRPKINGAIARFLKSPWAFFFDARYSAPVSAPTPAPPIRIPKVCEVP